MKLVFGAHFLSICVSFLVLQDCVLEWTRVILAMQSSKRERPPLHLGATIFKAIEHGTLSLRCETSIVIRDVVAVIFVGS